MDSGGKTLMRDARMRGANGTEQDEIRAFLEDPRNWPNGPDRIERIETHISHLFLGGNLALKMKKAVRLPYLDFSTLELRERFCRREVEINRLFSPELYLGLERVTRGRDGRLRIGNYGETVEWLVRMRRFDGKDILSEVARRGPLGSALVRALAGTVAESHRKAPVKDADGWRGIMRTVDELRDSALAGGRLPKDAGVTDFLETAVSLARRRRALLERRGASGSVRRCHGDLHLGNIVLWEGRPLLFDAIEFSEDLATVDVLNDLAFLLMDLVHRGQRKAANRLMNWWLQFLHEEGHHAALGLVGLYTACRAGIRAMVSVDLALQKKGREREEMLQRAAAYMKTANQAIHPPRPCIVAIGGFSGSGKTTLATALAPFLAPGPGAAHFRSDVERKLMAGVDEYERLGAEFYSQEKSDVVYRRIIAKARETAASGWVAVIDAVFLKAWERYAAEEAARAVGADFLGLWLEAPPQTLKQRVSRRFHDASDATPRIVDMQLAQRPEISGWKRISAEGGPDTVLGRVMDALGISPGKAGDD